MEMQKLLIADAVEEFRQALAEEFRGAYRLRVCREGRETLEMILAFKPDILVLDMMLPGLDGVSILEEVSKAGLHPTVLAVTKLPTDYVVNAAVRLGVGYLIFAPKEANYHFGYRCTFGMGSVEAWRFTQRLAGLVWGVLGLVMTFVMVALTGGMQEMELNDALWAAVKYVLWEVGIVLVSSVVINTVVMIRFTYSGDYRKDRVGK